MSSRPLRCVVAFAGRERQFLWQVELEEGATVMNALAAARRIAGSGRGPAGRTISG